MRKTWVVALAATMVMSATVGTAQARPGPQDTVRFATFNASLNRTAEGELLDDLSTPDDEQARAVAEVIQRSRPDVAYAFTTYP